MKNGIALHVITALLVLLFAYAVSAKLMDPEGFRGNMYNQDIPRCLALALIWGVPASEIAVVGCLLLVKKLRTGLIGSLVLLFIYTIYIAAILLHFFRRVPCPCGGVFHRMSWEQHLWFNMAFILLTLLGLKLDRENKHTRQLFFHQ